MLKRILSMLTALLMTFTLCASAEGFVETPEEMTQEDIFSVGYSLMYRGGEVLRGFLRGSDASAVGDRLEMAYADTDAPYIILGQPVLWDVHITGGTGNYDCLALIAYQDDLSLDPFEDSWQVLDTVEAGGEQFSYTFTEAGRYFIEFRVSDADGQFFYFQTRIYETYSSDDQTDAETVVGKANSIVAELIHDSMSDYTRALVLHDWLIYHANYDYTYTYYDAAGVLLYGTGVCDSYARAYLMLCTAAGLECLYVSGTAGSDPDPDNWGNHGWNLVRLGGAWYHVDCTWDDPGEGGSERHTYFCVSDETMAADHRWNRPSDVFDPGGMMVPDAAGGSYENADEMDGDYDFVFATIDEFEQGMNALVAAGEYRASSVGFYTGSDDLSTLWENFKQWYPGYAQSLANKGLVKSAGAAFQGRFFTLRLGWASPDEYVRIDETAARISIGETFTMIAAQAYPENALVGEWTSSDPSVATVTAAFDSQNGLHARITGHSAGTAVISVTTADGLSDSFTITVLPAYQPEISISIQKTELGVQLQWDSVPGTTVYRVQRLFEGNEETLAEIAETSVLLSQEVLPADVYQQICIIAERVIGGEVLTSFRSDVISYGTYVLTFSATLPADTLHIGAEAFLGNTSLTALAINPGAETIGNAAFYGCSALTVIRIPESVSEIAADAFTGVPLCYAVVSADSYAEKWFNEYMPHVILVY